MFQTLGQFSIFIKCVGIGGICGVFFFISNAFKTFFNKKILHVLFDLTAFLTASIIYVIFSYNLEFPSLRLYMIFGFIAGVYLYYKSFNFLLAKILKKPYNIVKIKIEKYLKEKRKTKDDRIKAKKISIRNHRRGSVASSDFGFGNDISVNIHKRSKQTN